MKYLRLPDNWKFRNDVYISLQQSEVNAIFSRQFRLETILICMPV